MADKVYQEYIGSVPVNNFPLDGLPIGAIVPYAGDTAPSGYLMCDGSEVEVAKYILLYNVIGNSFGTPSTSEKFKLPNLSGKFLEGVPSGKSVGDSISAGLPDITGSIYLGGTQTGTCFELWSVGGAFKSSTKHVGSYYSNSSPTSSSMAQNIYFKASDANGIYGSAFTVQPSSVCVNYIIKYVWGVVETSSGGGASGKQIETFGAGLTYTESSKSLAITNGSYLADANTMSVDDFNFDNELLTGLSDKLYNRTTNLKDVSFHAEYTGIMEYSLKTGLALGSFNDAFSCWNYGYASFELYSISDKSQWARGTVRIEMNSAYDNTLYIRDFYGTAGDGNIGQYMKMVIHGSFHRYR